MFNNRIWTTAIGVLLITFVGFICSVLWRAPKPAPTGAGDVSQSARPFIQRIPQSEISIASTDVRPLLNKDGTDTLLGVNAGVVYCRQLVDQNGNSVDRWIIVPNADANTFDPYLDGSPFSKDKTNVYVINCTMYNGYPPIRLLEGAVASSFAVVGLSVDEYGYISRGTYAKDSAHVYFLDAGERQLVVVQGADPGSFLIVRGHAEYDAEDSKHKFLMGMPI